MANFTAKVFSYADKLKRRIYRGSPNLFTDVDINQEGDVLEHQLDDLHASLGGYLYKKPTVNFTGSFPTTHVDVVFPSGSYLYLKGVRHPLSSISYTSANHTYNEDGDLAAYKANMYDVWVIAERAVLTSVDTSLAEIDGGGLPAPVAGADVVVYKNHRVAVTFGYGTQPTLSGAEEIIACIGQGVWDYSEDAQSFAPNYAELFPDVNDPDVYNTYFRVNPRTLVSIFDVAGTEFPPANTPESSPFMGLTGVVHRLVRNLNSVLTTIAQQITPALTLAKIVTLRAKWGNLFGYSKGTSITVTAGGTLTIPTKANMYELTFNTNNLWINNIVMTGNTFTAGDRLFFYCGQSHASWLGGFSVNQGSGTNILSGDTDFLSAPSEDTNKVNMINRTADVNYSGGVSFVTLMYTGTQWILERNLSSYEIKKFIKTRMYEVAGADFTTGNTIVGTGAFGQYPQTATVLTYGTGGFYVNGGYIKHDSEGTYRIDLTYFFQGMSDANIQGLRFTPESDRIIDYDYQHVIWADLDWNGYVNNIGNAASGEWCHAIITTIQTTGNGFSFKPLFEMKVANGQTAHCNNFCTVVVTKVA